MNNVLVTVIHGGGILLLFMAVPIVIGVAVYKDAKARGMEPWLWALVSALVPYCIGLIVYLVMRTSHKNLQCVACGAKAEPAYSLCPQCGSPLKYKCDACGLPVETDWALCANCGAALPQDRLPLTRPGGAKTGKALWIALGVLAALLLLAVAAVLVGGAVASTVVQTLH